VQPHRTKGFKLSTDPFFVEKVRDIVGLYLSPPANALVLCVDEKSQFAAEAGPCKTQLGFSTVCEA
jgi:putative transposase